MSRTLSGQFDGANISLYIRHHHVRMLSEVLIFDKDGSRPGGVVQRRPEMTVQRGILTVD